MGDLATCQPGWWAVFNRVDSSGFDLEAIACWQVVGDGKHPEAMCALGDGLYPARDANNFIGIVGPVHGGSATVFERAKKLHDAHVISVQKNG